MEKTTIILHLEGGVPRIVADQEIELIILDDDWGDLKVEDNNPLYDIPVNARQTLEYYVRRNLKAPEFSPEYVEQVKKIIKQD